MYDNDTQYTTLSSLSLNFLVLVLVGTAMVMVMDMLTWVCPGTLYFGWTYIFEDMDSDWLSQSNVLGL